MGYILALGWLADITPLFEDFLDTVESYTERLRTYVVSVPVSVHQPVPDSTLAVWLALAPDLSCTDST